MKLYFYRGPANPSLGRFGAVKDGNPLMLSDAEAAYVEQQRDRHCKAAKPGTEWPADAPEHLTALAEPEVMARLDLEGLTREQLKQECNRLGIAVGPMPSNQGMIARILEARRQSAPA